jgi:hypothetical protein
MADGCSECAYWGVGYCRSHRPLRELADVDGMKYDMRVFGESYVVVRPPANAENRPNQ